MKIQANTPLEDIAFMVGKLLKDSGVDAVLVGGAVVSIYSENKYQSYDLDFISHTNLDTLEIILNTADFYKDGNFFKHKNSDFFIEFPAPPVSVGSNPVEEFKIINNRKGFLKLLTPEHCIMDRLAAFYFWNDWQSMEQAVLVAKNQNVRLSLIEKWSENEGESEKYKIFLDKLKKKN